ncbi:alanyl-tRNA synthetase [Nematocida ausubeli]|uniref:Alanine--tRNA ligase n=1 Tax=Nematocida ausubeli (strain ATCC PRA-371 / ERTm2) TaxID=1913371 RepID=A0A086J4Z0_NEMA1|nr:alanyl-tRNA synthetase [Nematocida ausubeli]KFG27208.1 alanyl-tRNA synthetase [Nematocida ausubeli]
MWTANKLRNAFTEYFEKEGHTHWRSSSVNPDDPTLLFTNSGMVQFKKKFLDLAPADTAYGQMKRACNYQKCIRAGGKHNDLDDVGKDTYHHTFFEMLGNWSFGDYFKKEAIHFAWTFLTEVLKLDKDRIYVSYFNGDPSQGLPCDTESQELWRQYLPDSRILGFGAKENFWEMGLVGPCGPCSEIHYDRIGGRDASGIVNQDDPDVLEIWNVVFIQYNREESGLSVLPKKHIDTGMGLERVLSILQNEKSNYNTDLFVPLFKTIERVLGVEPYTDRLDSKKDIAYRVIADHSRTLTISLMDNVMPSSDGKGYTIRKILRRALGFQYLHLKKAPGLLPILAEQVFGDFSQVYQTELSAQAIVQIITEEEAQFTKTLSKGLSILMDMLETAKNVEDGAKKVLPGASAFVLYDRYGFPIDLTMAVADQEGVAVDVDGFKEAQAAAKALSKGTQKSTESLHLTVHDLDALDKALKKRPTVDRYKYSEEPISARTVAVKQAGEIVSVSELENPAPAGEFGIILDQTSFYSEAGGQEGDAGTIIFTHKTAKDAGDLVRMFSGLTVKNTKTPKEGNISGIFTVRDTKNYGRYVMHIGTLEGSITESAVCTIDVGRRRRLAHAHTGTHLLNYALSQTLSKAGGEEIRQCGSLVSEDLLRFDFHYNAPLSKAEISAVEEIINSIVERKEAVTVEYLPYTSAVRIEGIRHMKDEEYPETVRVVSVKNTLDKSNARTSTITSAELCGGTHVENTGDIGRVRIVGESSISRGIRRITAVCSERAVAAEKAVAEIRAIKMAPATIQEIRDRIDTTDIPLVDASQLRESLEEFQKQQIKERKKHFDGEAVRLKEALKGTEGKVMFVCHTFAETPVQQVNKLMGGLIQALEKEKREGLVLYEAEKDVVINGILKDGVEHVKSAFKELSADKAKIGGKSPRVMGVVSSGIETVQSALCGLMK